MNINVLPDLNPIEQHLWDQLDVCMPALPRASDPSASVALQEEWANIPCARIQRLIQFYSKEIVAQ